MTVTRYKMQNSLKINVIHDLSLASWPLCNLFLLGFWKLSFHVLWAIR